MLRGILTDRRLWASVGTGLGRDALMLGRPPAGEGVEGEEWGCVGVRGGAEVQRDSVTAGSQPPLARIARSNGEKLLRSLSEREFAGDAAWGDGGQTTEEETAQLNFQA